VFFVRWRLTHPSESKEKSLMEGDRIISQAIYESLREQYLKFNKLDEFGFVSVAPRPHTYDQTVVRAVKRMPLIQLKMFDHFLKNDKMNVKLLDGFIFLVEAIHLDRFEEYQEERESRSAGAKEIMEKYPWLKK
jgi:hypothetical protein